MFNVPVVSQNIKDSTLIYYNSINEIKNMEVTSKAFGFFENKSKEALKRNDTIGAAYYLELIALGQFKMGFPYESEATTIKAFKLLDPIKNNPKAIEPRQRLLNQLGMLYRKIEDFNNALRYYKQALVLNAHLVDKVAIVNNMANIYADQEQYDSAITELDSYYKEVLNLKDPYIQATYLDNLGYFQSKVGNAMAIKNMMLALDIRKKTEDLPGLFSSYRHMALYYFDRDMLPESREYSLKVQTIANTLNSPIYQLEAMKLLLKQDKNPVIENYLKLSLESEKTKQLQENKFAAIKYNIGEKEKLVVESELQQEKQRKLKLVYLFLMFVVLLSALFLWIILKSKHRKDKLQVVYTTESRISKKVHDEVANDVYHAMTKLQNNSNNKDDLLDDLEKIYTRTRDISKGISAINVKGNFNDLLYDLLISYKSEEVGVIAKNLSAINWQGVPDLKRATIYRVLQELMTNMRKHSKASIVLISFSLTKNKIVIDYKDNGIGCKVLKHNGLLNTENRMASINGTIIFDSEPNSGFKATITI
ncbi:ATP-binding protein [Mariniflexile sp. AS56]|nr:ATP-binding protein [Mariniflexile sp. AS56]